MTKKTVNLFLVKVLYNYTAEKVEQQVLDSLFKDDVDFYEREVTRTSLSPLSFSFFFLSPFPPILLILRLECVS